MDMIIKTMALAATAMGRSTRVIKRVAIAIRPRGRGRYRDDLGSIGEWVMILVMAVGIVLFIWSIAQPLLGSVLRSALSKLFR